MTFDYFLQFEIAKASLELSFRKRTISVTEENGSYIFYNELHADGEY